jgi:hypothetical protein
MPALSRSKAGSGCNVGYKQLRNAVSVNVSLPYGRQCCRIDRRATAVSPGNTHSAGVALMTAFAPPYRCESLVQSGSHLQPGQGASKGSEAGCNTWHPPRLISKSRSSFRLEKYRSTKLAGPSTAPSIPPELCSRNRESSRRNLRRSMCRL